MSLDSKINAFLKSPRGKEKIIEGRVKALKAGTYFGESNGSNSLSKTSAKEAAEKMKEILVVKLSEASLETIASEDIIIQEPVVNPDGTMTVGLSFNESALKRPSLDPENYDGVENIVVHLTYGWAARGRIRGYWENAKEMVWSRRWFDGDDFMQRAIDEFNSLEFGLAELDDKYLN